MLAVLGHPVGEVAVTSVVGCAEMGPLVLPRVVGTAQYTASFLSLWVLKERLESLAGLAPGKGREPRVCTAVELRDWVHVPSCIETHN
jgi:hypothetical protein